MSHLRCWKLALLLLVLLLPASVATAQLRVVTYNTLQGPNAGFATVVEAIGEESYSGFAKPIDVLLVQEVTDNGENGDTQQMVDLLNGIYGSGVYDQGEVNGASTSAIRQGIIYNTQTVQLIDEDAFGSIAGGNQERQTMRYQLRPVGYGSSADFYAYNNHYKAASSSSDQSQRLNEATALRANADALGEGAHFLFTGDFNMRSSNEAAFQELLSSGPGQANDPINRLGSWNNSSSFADVHTQSTCDTGCGNGFASGGVDDRFDLQLVSGEFLDGEGIDYISGSYHAFGNNGSTFNDAINVGNSITFSGITSFTKQQVLDALFTASDHLPVVADYQIPAVLEATPGAIPSMLAVGQSFDLDVLVRNAANVLVAPGADELDYNISVTGDLIGSGSGVESALGLGDTHFITLDTSSPGAKSGTINVTTDSQGAANAFVSIPVNFQVGGGGGTIETVIARAVFPTITNDLNVTDFQFSGGFTTEDTDVNNGGTLPVGSDARTLAFDSAGDMFGFEDRNDDSPFTVLDDSTGSNPSDTLGIVRASDVDNFFGVVDTENDDNSGDLTAEWAFDISDAVGGLMLSIDMAAMGDFEANNDSFLFEVSIDGSPFASPFAITIDDTVSQEYTLDDGDMLSLDDPVVVDTIADEPVVLDNNFQTFTVPLVGSGDELTLRFTASANGGEEAFAFRNILIEGLVNIGLTGDYNGDGTVNLADYTIWRDTLGMSVDNGTGADGSGNGVIDADDYDVWKTQFGQSVGQLAGLSASVPEPTSAALALLALGFVARSRRSTMRT